jgi:GNAT superfamily N-acetyltransferase
MRELILRSEDLGKLAANILGRGGTFSFKARGTSMVPYIQDGDIITIEPAKPSTLEIGTVALYRLASDRLVAHRVVAKEIRGSQTILTMRGEAAAGSGDKIRAEQVLGRVVSIRRDKEFNLQRFRAPFWIKISPVCPIFFRFFQTCKYALARLLIFFQTLKIYRAVARKLLKKYFILRIAKIDDALQLTNFYGHRKFPEQENFLGSLSRHTDYSYETAVIALVREKIAGAVFIKRFPEREALQNDYWLFGMLVRTRYRGAGIGEGLMHKALETARKMGANNLKLLVFEQNKSAITLYKKMGFTHFSTHQQNRGKDKFNENRRIIMSRSLQVPHCRETS